MRRRKELPKEITDGLINSGVSLILREIRNVFPKSQRLSDIYKFSFESFFEKLNHRIYTCLPMVGMNNISNFKELMEFEIKWYNIGGTSILDDGCSLRTRKNKIKYCVTYFIDDIIRTLGVYGRMDDEVKNIIENVSNNL